MNMAWSVSMDRQDPQEEADEESMARFELQFLLSTGLVHPNLFRFPGLCTCILLRNPFVLLPWL